MATDAFPAALTAVLVHEGGWSDHPADKGGATMRGVTQATYDTWRKASGLATRSVRYITDAELQAIYRHGYWDKCRCDELPAGVDYCTFDAAVNSGPSRAAKWLQAALGVQQDGVIGPITIAAANAASPRTTIREMCDERMAFLVGLKTWPTFKNGWSRRVDEVEAKALQMAAVLPGKPAPVPPQPDDPGPSHDPIETVPAPETVRASDGIWAALKFILNWLFRRR